MTSSGPGLLRVALTGGIAAGKTAVSDQLAERGAVVIDADVLAREVVAPGTPGWQQVRERFDVPVGPDGALDRAALGRLVFADATARRDLEGIVHPAVRARAAEIEAAVPAGAVVVHVIPLLVETGQERSFDVVVVVDVDPQTQLDRLQTRNGLNSAEARARVAAQASRERRRAAADVVLSNDRDLGSLQRDVDTLWSTLLASVATGGTPGGAAPPADPTDHPSP